LQVRQAYQAKGWVLNNLSGIEQCKNDGYLTALKEQDGEGCHIWGMLTVRRGRSRRPQCGVLTAAPPHLTSALSPTSVSCAAACCLLLHHRHHHR
jgi:hypothetical protein